MQVNMCLTLVSTWLLPRVRGLHPPTWGGRTSPAQITPHVAGVGACRLTPPMCFGDVAGRVHLWAGQASKGKQRKCTA